MTKINRERYKKITEEFVKGNIGYTLIYLAEDIQWRIPGKGTVSGKYEVLDILTLKQLERSFTTTIRDITHAGDVVIVESCIHGKHGRPFPFAKYFCDVFRFRDGKIQQITTYVHQFRNREMSESETRSRIDEALPIPFLN